MAKNLAKAGYEVLAWNRTPKEAEGLIPVESPKEAAGTGLITMLADDAATEAVLPEILEGLSRGGLHIAMLGCDPPARRGPGGPRGLRPLPAALFPRQKGCRRGHPPAPQVHLQDLEALPQHQKVRPLAGGDLPPVL